MRSFLTFSTCLALILLLNGMPKTDLRESDISRDLQLVITDESISGICFANHLISKYYESQGVNQQNITSLFSITIHTNSKTAIARSLFYMPQIYGWASWIGLSTRRLRPYRNPLRRFRLNKKQRKRLLKHLSALLTPENYHSHHNFSSNVGWV